MNKMNCPRCGANLVEDAWETLQENEDGGYIINSFPAILCENKCGYMKEVEMVPTAIAQRDNELLLLYPNDQGRILDIDNSLIFPPMNIDALLSKGYWEDYTGNHDIELLVEKARDSRAAYLETPNLFQFATSELSQDAFLCWLIAWGQQEFRSLNRELHDAAIDFITAIFNAHSLPAPIIESLKITRQFQSLDILVEINNKYAILIEDKTYTKDHSNQLVRYRKAVKTAYPNHIQLPIYYKIADQSNYRSPEDAGYIPFKRKAMLDILKRGIRNGVDNPIFIDYYKHLQQIERQVASYKTLPVEDWNNFAWQGFYQELQKVMGGNWGYVHNQSGGFWAYWWKSLALNPSYFLQLEQDLLCVKVKAAEGENKRELRKQALKEIKEESMKHGLLLQKPSKMGIGKTMTIAQRANYIQINEDGTVNIERTIEELRKY